MTTPAFLPVRPLSDQVWALLSGIVGINHFDGKVDIPPYDPAKPSTLPYWDLDSAGRPENVHAYAVFYPSPGRRTSSRLGAAPGRLAWSFQVTCVGGDRERAEWCVDKVTATLTGVRLTAGGDRTGKIREPADPGPIQVDRDVIPNRSYFPLLFGVHVAG